MTCCRYSTKKRTKVHFLNLDASGSLGFFFDGFRWQGSAVLGGSDHVLLEVPYQFGTDVLGQEFPGGFEHLVNLAALIRIAVPEQLEKNRMPFAHRIIQLFIRRLIAKGLHQILRLFRLAFS